MKRKIVAITIAAVVLFAAAFYLIRYEYVFGEGVKAGELNQFALKGYVFKTYEGRLILAGFKGGNILAAASEDAYGSYVFNFSVTNKDVAMQLMRCSGKTVELHYKEYLGTLPWRGMDEHIVDKILSVNGIPAEKYFESPDLSEDSENN